MRHPHRAISLLAGAAVVLALAGCSGDPAGDADDDAGATAGAAAEGEGDTAGAAEQAQETLDQAGIDVNAAGTAQVEFMGETHTLDAAEQFGCFIVEDGGSEGAVNFDGSDDAGNELYVEWAGDSTEFGRIDFTATDGTGWTTLFGTELEVIIDGSSAEVSSTMVRETGGDATEEQLTASLACGD